MDRWADPPRPFLPVGPHGATHAVDRAPGLEAGPRDCPGAAKLDPCVAVLRGEHGDQLSLPPGEPVTLVKDGKPRKVSKQPLTDQHIYALLVEVAPSESANHIDTGTEAEFEYIADRGMVRVRIVPEMGRLTPVVSPKPPPPQP